MAGQAVEGRGAAPAFPTVSLPSDEVLSAQVKGDADASRLGSLAALAARDAATKAALQRTTWSGPYRTMVGCTIGPDAARSSGRRKDNPMKRRLTAGAFAAAFAVSAFAGTALAAAPAGDNPNNNACFGQARSDYMTTEAPGTFGAIASEWQSFNAVNAANWRVTCQLLP